MAEFYSNLPQKLKDSLQKTANRLIDENYKTKFEFAVNDYDATVGFFVKRAQLSELISTVLNANRYKSSRLGVRNTRETKDSVSRNILD